MRRVIHSVHGGEYVYDFHTVFDALLTIPGVDVRKLYIEYTKPPGDPGHFYIWIEYPVQLDGVVKHIYRNLGWTNIEINSTFVKTRRFVAREEYV